MEARTFYYKSSRVSYNFSLTQDQSLAALVSNNSLSRSIKLVNAIVEIERNEYINIYIYIYNVISITMYQIVIIFLI